MSDITLHCNGVSLKQDWSYSMRQDKQMIVKGIFLGPYAAASKTQLHSLMGSGVTHIVCVRHKLEAKYIRPNFPENFRWRWLGCVYMTAPKYLVLDLRDDVFENIMVHFVSVNTFIEEAVSSGGSVLVHGNAGISRSATLVIAFIMWKYALSSRDAYRLVRDCRFCINPNLGFMQQLKEYEPICQARRSCSETISSNNSRGVKRCASQVEMAEQ